MEKSRTRNVGDKMAHCGEKKITRAVIIKIYTIKRFSCITCSAHPRATASSALRVVLGSFPNTCLTACLTRGTRVLPPTISTAAMSSLFSSAMHTCHVSKTWLLFRKLKRSPSLKQGNSPRSKDFELVSLEEAYLMRLELSRRWSEFAERDRWTRLPTARVSCVPTHPCRP